MTIDEMIETLEDARDEHGGHQTILIAHQPHWPFEPFEYETAQVGVTLDGTVYIAEGEQLGCLQHDGAVAIGWAAKEWI
jgi:hypothetical protein